MKPSQQWAFAGVFLSHCSLWAATMPAAASFYEQGRRAEAAGQWEAAYQAYVQAVEHGETPAAAEDERPIDRVYRVATEHLGWFDEANAYAEQYLSLHKDGYLHRLRGYFYKDKLHDYDKAREQFRQSHDDYKAEENQLYDALYSLDEEAECYRTQLFEMEYYTNRRNRQIFTRKAHDILLEGFSQVDNVANERERKSISNIFMESLAYIYAQKWYAGHDLELAAQYTQHIRGNPVGTLSPFGETYEVYEQLAGGKKWAEAARLWEQYAERYPAITNQFDYLELLAMCYHRAREWENTLRTAGPAMDLIEKKFEALNTDIEKSYAMESGWLATYERALDAAEALKRYDAAFDVTERFRARAMLDLLGGRDYSKRQARISDDEKEMLLLRSRRDEIQDAIEHERGLGRPEELASLQRSLTLIEDSSSSIQRRVEIGRREILSAGRVEPVSSREAQALFGEDTLISIFDGIHMSVVTKNQVTSRYIVRSTRFDKLIREYRAAIESQGNRARALVPESAGKKPADADAETAAQMLAIEQELYDIIIRPMEKNFSQTSDRIYIVYDRMHPLIPYEVLHDGRQYIAEKYTLVYEPSMSVLKKCMERRHPMGQKLVALGNPDLRNPNFNLAYAEDEVKKLAEIYPDSRILTGAEASEAAVQLLAPDADILHLACHGAIDENDPKKSHLRLAPDKDNDGYLTADEIMDMNLQCSLVTLSACDTGRGKIVSGGEVLGLTRAWIYAGTPSVLASLWKVDDRATSQLMTAFYENLKTHDKAKSLQLAQIDMINEGLSPFYWAAFCLYGDCQ